METRGEEAIRRKKIERLREEGIDPFPAAVSKTHTIEALKDMFTALLKKEQRITVLGRLLLIRRQGGLTFGQLHEGTGTIQIIIRKDKIGEAEYARFLEFVDRGDFLEVSGTPFVTKAGEESVLAESWRLVVKAVKPLPEKWHGLKDKEERFRRRYLDMLMNPEVRERFVMRARIINSLRHILESEGFIEIEPPALQPVYGGGFAHPFVTHHNALDIDLYLPISNEMYLKRMLVGGFEKVYSMTKIFRNEGIDHDHNPEFTMLEANFAYADYHEGMELIERLFEETALAVHGATALSFRGMTLEVKRPWKRMRMTEAIKETTGMETRAWKSVEEAHDAIRRLGIPSEKIKEMETMHSVGELIAFLFELKVEETLLQPTIVYDYPVEVCPLAKRSQKDPAFAERFESFAAGFELGNNYTELNDPLELKERFVDEKQRKEAGFAEAHEYDQDYLDAVGFGMPPNCGIAIGIDRMVMLFADAPSIKEVIAFPTMRPLEAGE